MLSCTFFFVKGAAAQDEGASSGSWAWPDREFGILSEEQAKKHFIDGMRGEITSEVAGQEEKLSHHRSFWNLGNLIRNIPVMESQQDNRGKVSANLTGQHLLEMFILVSSCSDMQVLNRYIESSFLSEEGFDSQPLRLGLFNLLIQGGKKKGLAQQANVLNRCVFSE